MWMLPEQATSHRLEQLQRVMHEQSQLHAKLHEQLMVQRAEQTSLAQMLSVSQHAILEPQQLMRLAQHVMLQRQLLQHLFALLHAYTEDLLREASQLANHEEHAWQPRKASSLSPLSGDGVMPSENGEENGEHIEVGEVPTQSEVMSSFDDFK